MSRDDGMRSTEALVAVAGAWTYGLGASETTLSRPGLTSPHSSLPRSVR